MGITEKSEQNIFSALILWKVKNKKANINCIFRFPYLVCKLKKKNKRTDFHGDQQSCLFYGKKREHQDAGINVVPGC